MSGTRTVRRPQPPIPARGRRPNRLAPLRFRTPRHGDPSPAVTPTATAAPRAHATDEPFDKAGDASDAGEADSGQEPVPAARRGVSAVPIPAVHLEGRLSQSRLGAAPQPALEQTIAACPPTPQEEI